MKKNVLLSTAFMVLLLFPGTEAFACTVCHSKNPKMVRMHAALGYKDCFTCHGPQAARSPEGPAKEMNTSPRCVRCHAAPAPAPPPR